MQFDVNAAFDGIRTDDAGYQWRFSFGEDLWVQVGGLWRYLVDGRIKWVSEDHQQQFGLPAPVDLVSEMSTLLSGRTVQSVTMSDATGDLELTFDDRSTIEALTTSAGYESWECGVSEHHYICVGGGELARFPHQRG